MTHLHGIRPYWLTVAFEVGERLRAGHSRIYPRNARTWAGQIKPIPRMYCLIREPYSDAWIPGPGTYAAIEAHIVRKALAMQQLRDGLFPTGLPNARPLKRKNAA